MYVFTHMLMVSSIHSSKLKKNLKIILPFWKLIFHSLIYDIHLLYKLFWKAYKTCVTQVTKEWGDNYTKEPEAKGSDCIQIIALSFLVTQAKRERQWILQSSNEMREHTQSIKNKHNLLVRNRETYWMTLVEIHSKGVFFSFKENEETFFLMPPYIFLTLDSIMLKHTSLKVLLHEAKVK